MTKRHVYSGLYTRRLKLSQQDTAHCFLSPLTLVQFLGQWQTYSEMAYDYLSAFYTLISENYLVVATIFIVVVLSFLLPDITQKRQATHDLKNVQKVLENISTEVKQAEVACSTMAGAISSLHCSMHDDTTTDTSKNLRDLSICTSQVMRTTQSEPARIEKGINFFPRIFYPNKNTSHKEVTIMSYVYTDSFDGENKEHTTS